MNCDEEKIWAETHEKFAAVLTAANVPWGLVPGYLDYDNLISQDDMLE